VPSHAPCYCARAKMACVSSSPILGPPQRHRTSYVALRLSPRELADNSCASCKRVRVQSGHSILEPPRSRSTGPRQSTAYDISPAAMTTHTQTRAHAGHSHHHHHDNTFLLSKNKSDAGVRITRIGLYVNLGMAVSKGFGGYVFNSQGQHSLLHVNNENR
jgi:hypothetical protein